MNDTASAAAVDNASSPAWKKIVVCLVFDGIDPCDPGTLDVLQTIGVFQDGIMKKDIDGKETVSLLFMQAHDRSCTSSNLRRKLLSPLNNSLLPPTPTLTRLERAISRPFNSCLV